MRQRKGLSPNYLAKILPDALAASSGQNLSRHDNRPFAQLLPGLETGHPVTVGQSPAYDFRKLFSCLRFGLFCVRFMCR